MLRDWFDKLRKPAFEPELPPVAALFAQAALERAWRMVKHNGGAAGVDRMTVRRFEQRKAEEFALLQGELLAGTYRPHPVKRVYVPKSNEVEQRPLSIWVVRDRIVQRLIYDYLAPIYEPTFLDSSFGFRAGKGVPDAIEAVVRWRDANRRWVVDGDIQSCFDSIDTGLLLTMLRKRVYHPAVLRLLELWFEAEIFNTLDGRPAKAGVSQGSVLAPLLCNVFLHSFDLALTQGGGALVRYADDWLILCRRRQDAEAAQARAAEALTRLRLTLHPKKTQVVNFDTGFTFLGFFFLRRGVFNTQGKK